jgi:hypothetical protein
MIDDGGAPIMRADRVRVSRRTLGGGGMIDHGGAAIMPADRVRVSRRAQEEAA